MKVSGGRTYIVVVVVVDEERKRARQRRYRPRGTCLRRQTDINVARRFSSGIIYISSQYYIVVTVPARILN